jgi:hypothetical protein
MLKSWAKTTFADEELYYTNNETGRFYCDEQGVLEFFATDRSNHLYNPPFGYHRFDENRSMRLLTIPEGIRVIGKQIPDSIFYVSGTLQDLVIIERLELPTTLEKLEEHVLSCCLIMELELPASLREIGPAAVMNGYIHTLRIPNGLPHPQPPAWDGKKDANALTIHGRQFKETIVDTLIVPRDYPYRNLLVEAKINHVIYSD